MIPLKRSFVEIESEEDSMPMMKSCRHQSVPTMVHADDISMSLEQKIQEYCGGFTECHQFEIHWPEAEFASNTPSSRETKEHITFQVTPDSSVLDLTQTSRNETTSESLDVYGVRFDGYQPPNVHVERLESLLKREATHDDIQSPQRACEKELKSAVPAFYNGISLSERRSCLMENKRRTLTWIAFLIFLVVVNLCYPSTGSNHVVDPNSVYVSGGGFSGFWFSIGRLQSVENQFQKNYYCYSAGCLAVVAALSNSTLDQMSDLCFGVQRRWQTGETKHHDVVSDFLDNFLELPNVKALLHNEELLAKINIITAVKDVRYGLKSVIRSPSGKDDLYLMLLQTTWIPFATGKQIWETSSPDGQHHMDGIFSPHDHPVCAHDVGLPWTWDLRINALNVNLGADKVAKLWKEGLAYGL